MVIRLLFQSVLPTFRKLFTINRTLAALSTHQNNTIVKGLLFRMAKTSPSSIYLASIPCYETVTAATAIRFENLASAYQRAASVAWSAITSRTPMGVRFTGSTLQFFKKEPKFGIE